ncbi:MAG TPA: sigma-70 family RNA polymerase sigma factor [Polyangia bacterium]|jgi:RNA polymerase sigma factor (sigma-70 family)|nr:sigma-70 family RNA polymerase sigma factor [Polyangia bacterium]
MANDCARGNSTEETALLSALLATRKKAEHDRLWAELVQRYERLIVSCVVKALRRYGATFSRDDLDDLVGDVWLVLLRDDLKKLRQYDATRGFRIASFLGLVATNATIDHLRARQAESTPLDDVIEDYASLRAEAPRDVVEARQEAELARAALAQLSSDERAFVVDCFRDERSPEELARALGVTTNTVYSRKFKIREKLQKIVRTLDGAPVAA